ncbi:MAG: UvrD-helicase domain-containing protein [Clostridia bacterium]|nr:UvrD-helicase domain-containing protein [Clostridia bacterium]
MKIMDFSYSSYEIPQNIKEGMIVLFVEKNGNDAGCTIVARIANLEQRGNDYKVNLIEDETGEYIGGGRAWMLKKALQLGTILIPESGEIKVCPSCKKNLLDDDKTICLDCIREEKKNFFATRVELDGKPFVLDNEQADAIISSTNSIVTARAGSGKTRVLTAKLIDLFFNQGIKEDEVLAFCFNRGAAKEIRDRLNSKCKVDGESQTRELDVVSTFHAYAKATLGDDCGKILVDEPAPVRTRLIKEIISKLRSENPKFEKILRKYFLSDTLKIDRKKFNSIEHYYQFVRNSRYRTLKGEHVKSIPEKIIADFLFEHGIRYKYERHFYLNKIDLNNHNLTDSEFLKYKSLNESKKETVPDFYLEDYNLIWEHWGITGRETAPKKDEFTRVVGDYDAYARTKEWKRSFWNSWRHKLNVTQRYVNDFKSIKKLIETDPDYFQSSERSDIELKLKKLLESNGVKCKKLSEDTIMENVWKNAEDYFTKQIRQFIDKFQQIYLNDERLFVERANQIYDEREKNFLRLGYMVYQEYNKVLFGNSNEFPQYKEYKLDFNHCLNFAAKKIRSGECDSSIKHLKWILIDEYQDFSELFHNLICAILSRNPDIVLFCVGDDWQAINRFAGSDLKFFLDFKRYFSNSTSYNIGTNYRCENHIVKNAGDFMKRFGIRGKEQRGFLSDSGVFKEEPIDAHLFDIDIDDFDWLVSEGGDWEQSETVNKRNVQAYIKVCTKIINENPGKKIMILNRKGSFLGKDLDEIEKILKHPRLCKTASPDFSVKTVHSSKGEEADIVILTDVDENSFPIFHPDSNLYSVFGENEQTIMEDEARLYYVALTRAKHSIYIFFSKDNPSCFIKNPYQINFNNRAIFRY